MSPESSSPELGTAAPELPRRGDQFQVPTERIREFHLAGRAAVGFEEAGVGDEDAGAAGAGGRHVEAAGAVEELHASGRFFGLCWMPTSGDMYPSESFRGTCTRNPRYPLTRDVQIA